MHVLYLDIDLAAALAFIAEALRSGETVIVLATAEQRAALGPLDPRILVVDGGAPEAGRLLGERVADERSRDEVARRLAGELQIANAEARVRLRLAFDLHDAVGQLLVGGKILAGNLAQDVPAELQPRAARVAALFDQALAAVRAASHDLSVGSPPPETLPDAMRRFADHTTTVFGVPCSLSVEAEAFEVDGGGQQWSQVFLVMREAVLNAVKHSRCSRIDVYLEARGGWNALRVRDDGSGPPEAVGGQGIGLPSMAFRARMLGGELRINRLALGGTEVLLRWPGTRRATSSPPGP